MMMKENTPRDKTIVKTTIKNKGKLNIPIKNYTTVVKN